MHTRHPHGGAHRGRPHHHPFHDSTAAGELGTGGRRGDRARAIPFALSLEVPGSRPMRGLGGYRGGGPRRGPTGDHEHDRGRGPGRYDRGHGRRGPLQARRGIVREAILGLLAEQPMHGYQIIQELSARTGGRWQPSAGSIYPTLQQLEDEGVIAPEERDGRRTFALTDAGRALAAAQPAGRPWSDQRAAGGRGVLRGLAREIGIAAHQVARVGSPAAQAEAEHLLAETRRRLYRLLADDATADVADIADADGTASGSPTADRADEETRQA